MKNLKKQRRPDRTHALIMEHNPTLENRRTYNTAINNAKEISKESKRENGTKTSEDLNLVHGGREAWTLLTNLSGEN